MPANRVNTGVVSWDEDGPVTREQHDSRKHTPADADVAQPDPADIGPVTDRGGAPEAAAGESPSEVDTSEVPTGAAEVVAWIRDAGDSDEAARRAELAWTAETERSDGVRSTVDAEVAKHLETAPDGDDS